jgi:hypothetical protein
MRWIPQWATLGLFAMAAAGIPLSAHALTLYEVQKLLASDGPVFHVLGYSVAVSDNTAVIGAPAADDSGPGSGAAYVFSRDIGGPWVEQAKLLASDGAAFDLFGWSVAVSGDTAVIGALSAADTGPGSGAAYVFTRDAGGTWTEQAKLLASDGTADDPFGRSVAVSGDTAVIAAQSADDRGPGSGAAYVFTRNAGGTWAEQVKLLASDGAADDAFGVSVAVSGETAVIGAIGTDDKGPNSGAAYVFTRVAGGPWTEQAKLLPSDGTAGDRFGFSVAVSGETAVIGAPFRDGDTGPDSGAAYVFTGDAGGTWTEQAKLLASDRAARDQFGWSVAVFGGTAVIGAPLGGDDTFPNPGAAYVFTRDVGGTWSERAKLLASDGATGDRFGFSAAVSGETAVIGAPLVDGEIGAAYLFSLALTPGEQLAHLYGEVQALVEAGRVPRGLLAPLEAAGVSLAQGNTRAIVGQLGAFARQVTAMVRSGWLSEAEGAELMEAANQLLDLIDAG